MKLKQISIFIENSSERLYDVTKLLGDAGINLRALSLVDKGEFGILRLLVSNMARTRRIIMEKHFPAQVDDVVVAAVPGAAVDDAGQVRTLNRVGRIHRDQRHRGRHGQENQH